MEQLVAQKVIAITRLVHIVLTVPVTPAKEEMEQVAPTLKIV